MICKIVTLIVVFIIETFTAWLYFEYFFQRKKERFYSITSFFIAYSILFGITFFNNAWINLFFFYVINVSIICLNYDFFLTNMLLNTGFLTFLLLASEGLCVVLLKNYFHNFSCLNFIISKFLSVFFYFSTSLIICINIDKKSKNPPEKHKKTLSLCILPFISIIITFTLICAGIKIKYDTILNTLILISIILLLFVNILVLLIYRHMQNYF